MTTHLPREIRCFKPSAISKSNKLLRQIFMNRVARVLWCQIKSSHLASQHFDQSVWDVAEAIREQMPETPEALSRTLTMVATDPAVRKPWEYTVRSRFQEWERDKMEAANAADAQKRLEIFTELHGMIRGQIPFKLTYS